MFEQTKDALSPEGRELAEQAKAKHEAIPLEQLAKSFVHGDIIKSNVIVGDDGELYVIDFACANTYPKVQEIAVMAANLMFDEKQAIGSSLKERVAKVLEHYITAGGELNEADKEYTLDYAIAGAAMEYMGSVHERLKGDESEEIDYWERQGLISLQEALSR
ncbi:hypothetical protein EYC59_02425 [Candidatus Saccharibacteria bacterium]|nr:MAG: hypothetical protein EYC59_02425 [Candidatus Saccharibacteria bacterium]